MLWRQITLHLCWKTYTGYESRKWSSTSYLSSLRSSVNIVWHHPTCPTNFNKSLEWSPDSVWDHRVRQRSSYQLLEGRQWVTEHFLSLPVEQSAVNSHCCVNPAFIPPSPENSSIHHIFPTILVTLSASWANVTCLCSFLTLHHPNLFFFTLHYIRIEAETGLYKSIMA